MSTQGSILGNAVLRREDPTLLRGEEEYTDDLKIDGLHHVKFVRSPFAHANLGAIDTSEAAAVDGATQNQTFLRIILPLATPALAVTAFSTFEGEFNARTNGL